MKVPGFQLLLPLVLISPCLSTTFQLTEVFGVSHPKQVVELVYGGPALDPGQTYMSGPDGTEVPFQQLSTGNILVETDLPAGSSKTFQLKTGRAPAAGGQVTVSTAAGWIEVMNGLTGVRVARPRDAGQLGLSPIQGIRLRDGTWTGAGPNYLYDPPIAGANVPYGQLGRLTPLTANTQVIERGPLRATVQVSYTFNRPDLTYALNLLIPGGPGYFTSTIKLEAGQQSIVVEDDTDMDLQYYINVQGEVQPTQLRYRNLVGASRTAFGREADGQRYRSAEQRPEMDAIRELPQDVPVYSEYVTDDYGAYQYIKRVLSWDLWAANGGRYWMMYDSRAGAGGPVVGLYAGGASRVIGGHASGPGVYALPDSGQGMRSSGINFRANRRGADAKLSSRVRMSWGIFVGTKGADLGDPTQTQTIQRPLNLYGGINLSKVLGYQSSYADPAGGWSSLYLSREQTQALIGRARSDDAFYARLYSADATMRPLLDAWRDRSGARAKALAAEISTFARTLLDVYVNGNGIYDYLYQYWMGGVEMSRRALTGSALLAGDQLAAADRDRLKAALALFANLLWDNDYAPLFDGHLLSMGSENMPVQQGQYRNQYTLMLAQHPLMAGTRVADSIRQSVETLEEQVNEHGAQHGSPHYVGASMGPLVNFLEQIKVAGLGDAFRDQPKMAKFGEFYLNLQTPPEVRFGGVRKMVSLGDGSTEGSDLAGQLATGFADSDPSLSQRLMQAWVEGGRTESGFFGNTALKVDERLSAAPQQLGSATFPGYYTVLRQGCGTDRESAAWVINGDWYSDHRHDDGGSTVLYALGAPLALDWGSLYTPHAAGAYQHNLVLPEAAIGARWDQDSLPMDTGVSPWTSARQVAFESFESSSRAVSSFSTANGTRWSRTVRLLGGNPATPAILIEDNFTGPGADTPKVWSMNLMAKAAVETPQGTVIPPLRLWDSAPQLPSAGPAQALAPGLNRFHFTGQWKIDWDLYTYSTQDQQALLGNWAHDWIPTVEQGQFQAANGRPFRERQNILRLRSQGPFRTLILPNAKGESRADRVIPNQEGGFAIHSDGAETLVDSGMYAYHDGARTIVTSYGEDSIAAYGIEIGGGPAEVRIAGGRASLTIHGSAGQRRVVLSPGVEKRSYVVDYSGGGPLVIELEAVTGRSATK